jgi:hypothetical protein
LSARQTGKCLRGNMKIKVRNKKTGEEKEVTIKKFFEMNVRVDK